MHSAVATTKKTLTQASLTLAAMAVLIVVLLFCGTATTLTADDLAWHDHRFMEMLSRSHLDRLARIHATRQRDQATNSDKKAVWQQTLAELARVEMWFADGQDRSEILQNNLKGSLAIKGIKDPLLRFRLSMETGRMIRAESAAALITAEAGSLYGKQRALTLAAVSKRSQQLAGEIQRLETSEREMSGRDSPLNSEQKTRARDELRILLANIKCQKFHWLAAIEPTKLIQPLNALNVELERMTRSTRAPRSKTQLRLLLADLAARYSSSDDYRLKMTPLLSESPYVRPSEVAEIRIRYRLRQREVETAEQYLPITSTLTVLEKQKQLWLAAEVCVGQTTQASRLDDTQMISVARNRLTSLQSVVAESESGTYIDAARRCLQKAERILELGPELAALLEQVDISRQLGENQNALRQIKAALQHLPANESHAARPSLLLIATQLNIDRQLWADAIITGHTAAAEFQHHHIPQKAAAADLLKCFAMAQVINDRPNGRTDYLAALKRHTQNFTDSPTSAIAVKWILQLTTASSPEVAVQVVTERLKTTDDSVERNELLSNAETIFWQLLTTSDMRFDQQIGTWREELHQAASSDIDSRLAAGNQTSIAIQLVLNPATVSKLSSWQQMLASQAAQRPSVQQNLQHQLLNFVLSVKLSAPTITLTQQRQQILKRPSAELEQAFYYLTRVLDRSKKLNRIQPGDVFLARTIDQLALNLMKTLKPQATVAIKLLPIISITALMTGDQDAMQQVMAAVSPDRIPKGELQGLVASLSRLSSPSNGKQTAITPKLRSVLINFWKRVITSQPAGSDLWLEGLIQVGTLSSAAKERDQLERQFRMANVLYPEWGDAERKVRATAILNKLQNTP